MWVKPEIHALPKLSIGITWSASSKERIYHLTQWARGTNPKCSGWMHSGTCNGFLGLHYRDRESKAASVMSNS